MLPVKRLKNVEGRLLTIIDAVMQSGQQAESVKSLVRQTIGDLYSYADYSQAEFTMTTSSTGNENVVLVEKETVEEKA